MDTLRKKRDDYAERDEAITEVKEQATKLGIEFIAVKDDFAPRATEIIDDVRTQVQADTGQDILDAGIKELSGNLGEFHPANDNTYYEEDIFAENTIDENFEHVAEHEAWHAANDNRADVFLITESAVNAALAKFQMSQIANDNAAEGTIAAPNGQADGKAVSATAVNEALTEKATAQTTGKTIAYGGEIVQTNGMESRTGVLDSQMIDWFKSGTNSKIVQVMAADRVGVSFAEFSKQVDASNDYQAYQQAA